MEQQEMYGAKVFLTVHGFENLVSQVDSNAQLFLKRDPTEPNTKPKTAGARILIYFNALANQVTAERLASELTQFLAMMI